VMVTLKDGKQAIEFDTSGGADESASGEKEPELAG